MGGSCQRSQTDGALAAVGSAPLGKSTLSHIPGPKRGAWALPGRILLEAAILHQVCTILLELRSAAVSGGLR